MARPTSPIILKQHHNVIDKNPKDYKQNYYVVNDENYLIALYRGKDDKGKVLSDYLVSNLLDSVQKKQSGKELYPKYIDKKGQKLSLYKVLKIGKVVILKQDENEDVFALSKSILCNRLFRVSGLAKSSGSIQIKISNLITQNPWEFVKGEHDINDYVEHRLCSPNNFIGLVEGTNFTISPAGEIIRIPQK